MQEPPSDAELGLYFSFLTEVGIINQLSNKALESYLPAGLLAPHFGILVHLSRRQDVQTPLTMATAFQVPKTTMTHQLTVLQRHQLVIVQPNPNDGRSKVVQISQAGQTLCQQIMVELSGESCIWFDDVSANDMCQALQILEKVRAAMDKARD